jgi:hypothetical protein
VIRFPGAAFAGGFVDFRAHPAGLNRLRRALQAEAWPPQLAKIRGLRVAARSSAFTFKGKGATVDEVGRALNVATVLEGSVRKAGNRMRISVQLVAGGRRGEGAHR